MWEERLSASLNLSKKIEAAREESELEYASEIKKIDDKEKELNSRIRELEEEKLKAAAKYGNVDCVSDDDLIEINAGGRIIVLQRGLCCQDKLISFGMLFDGRWEKRLPKDDSGRVFFDVNPEAIQYFVDDWHEQAISSPGQQRIKDTLINRVKRKRALGAHIHQQINILGTPWKKRAIFGSNIFSIGSDHESRIGDWLAEQGLGGAETNLLYRGSRDGFSSDDFHSKCDNKGHTLVIIETDAGGVFGGYTDAEWGQEESQMDQKHACANKAFLFAIGLHDLGEHHSWKSYLKAEDGICAISTHEDFGPVFGDIDVRADLSVQGRIVTLNLGGSYESKYEQLTEEQGNYFIKEIEVFQISQDECKNLDFRARMKRYTIPPKIVPFDRFAKAVNNAMYEKLYLLDDLEAEVTFYEHKFVGEKRLIESLSMMKGSNKDIISLNVSGTVMTTTRATLRIIEESVLAQQFDDTKWTEQGHNNPRVNEWTYEEVATWVRSIKDVPDEVAQLFSDNEINGSELLALNEFGLKEMGIKRIGTICLLMKEIKQLEKSNQDVSTLIEHSPYCFGKILDFLRLMRFHSLNLLDEEPSPPKIDKLERKRFEKIVKYYFPGDCAELLLGPSQEEEEEEEEF